MRRIVLHRKATRYLRRMPRDRQRQMVKALEEVAACDDIEGHPNVRSLSGAYAGRCRLRVGVYRAILVLGVESGEDVLYVDYIGPRGDAY